MSSSGTSGPASPSQPRLGPAWRSASSGGRGFQPPSAALEQPGSESKDANRNSFSLLDDDDVAGAGGPKKSETNARSSRMASSPKRTFASRSEGFRSAGLGSGGFASRSASKGGTSGRSLADLVSRFPSSEGTAPRSTSGVRTHRSSSGDDGANNISSITRSSVKDFVDDKKVIRFTRERLLSMRPRTDPDATSPDALACLEGTSLLSKTPLDPVCWDNFDAEEIWNQAKERRVVKAQSTGMPMTGRREVDPPIIRNPRNGGGGDSWRRGVALPPGGEGGARHGSGRYDSEDPDDLWDDPMSLNEAAADFSAFGGSLDDVPKSAGKDAFDLTIMAEAAKEFDDDIRGNTENGDANCHDHNVNPTRPLASAGTTIRSGSGDNVNVFEDFDAPRAAAAAAAAAAANDDPIRSGDDAKSASSRLMQMIGVSSGENKESGDPVILKGSNNEQSAESNIFSAFGASAVPSNPWGTPMAEPPSQHSNGGGGLDLSAKLREVRLAEKQNSEMELMKKREQEEEQRRAAMLAQQQAEAQARQAAMQKQQQQPQQPEYSQVELILTERISTILENSWGRSDLMTVLQTLHNDDPRVVPLLGTVDALRALIVRHPRRFALTKDPTFGAEMAVLVMNNNQWQQHQASEEMKRRQQDEQHEQQKVLAAKQEAESRAKAEAEARASEAEAEARASENIVITDAPWYYADPQGNIQGPFGGDEMRQWLGAGYFKGDLPISQNQNGGFRALSSLFADVSVAFKPTGPSEEEKARIAAEMEARAKAEAAARAEAEAREKAEMESRAAVEAEAARQANLQSNHNQSAQLKMLLGLGGSDSNQVAGVEFEEPAQQIMPESSNMNAELPATKTNDKIEEPAPQSKPAKSKAKKNKAKIVEQNPVTVPEPTAPAPTPAWGGAASKTQSKSKSMSEIQMEEARVTAHLAKQRKNNPQPAGGGWAGIAASGGTTAWSGAAVKAPALNTASNTSSTAKQTRGTQHISKATGNNQSMSNRSSTQQALEDFGANDKMTPGLEIWCKEQMKNLNGSEDLTLVAFCMTLTDSVEIKQYLTAYLGSTSQVNSFATEFISRKNGSKQQEQWETTGSSKKGRKKKGIVGK